MKIGFIGVIALAFVLFTGCGEVASDDEEAGATSDPYQNTIAYNLNDEVEESINITANNEEDVFKLTLTDTGIYTVYLELQRGTTGNWAEHIRIDIYDQDGNRINGVYMYGEVGAWRRFTLDIYQTGNYYARIVRDSNEDTKYKFSVHSSMANGYVQDNENEHNDIKEMATPITLTQASSEINGSLYITDNKDSDDWYKLPLSETGTYTVYCEMLNGSQEESSHHMNLYIYSEDGTELNKIILAGRVGLWNRVTFEVNVDDNYYIQVQRDGLPTKYAFSIYPSVANGYVQDSNNEHNDVKEMATPITLVQASTTIKDSINVTDKTDVEDWYAIDLNAGSYTVKLGMMTGSVASWSVYQYIIVYEDDGTELINNTYEGVLGTATMPLTVHTSGTHYIQIYRNNNNITEYNLTITNP